MTNSSANTGARRVKNWKLKIKKMIKNAFLLISLLTLTGACVTVGPKKDNLSILLKAALPEDEQNPDYFGYGAWIPNSKGFTSDFLKPFQTF